MLSKLTLLNTNNVFLGVNILAIAAQVEELLSQIQTIEDFELYGHVESTEGLSAIVRVNSNRVHIGTRCRLQPLNHATVFGEVVSFNNDLAKIMTFQPIDGLHPKCLVTFLKNDTVIYPCMQWQGRVINGLAEPIDGKGSLSYGSSPYSLRGHPIPAHSRAKVCNRIELGVRAIDTFLTCCKGQRLGIFSGSGVGKSVLLSMLVKFADCDICIVGLIGERGREVR